MIFIAILFILCIAGDIWLLKELKKTKQQEREYKQEYDYLNDYYNNL